MSGNSGAFLQMLVSLFKNYSNSIRFGVVTFRFLYALVLKCSIRTPLVYALAFTKAPVSVWETHYLSMSICNYKCGFNVSLCKIQDDVLSRGKVENVLISGCIRDWNIVWWMLLLVFCRVIMLSLKSYKHINGEICKLLIYATNQLLVLCTKVCLYFSPPETVILSHLSKRFVSFLYFPLCFIFTSFSHVLLHMLRVHKYQILHCMEIRIE